MFSPLWDGLLHCSVTAVSPISVALKLLGWEGTPGVDGTKIRKYILESIFNEDRQVSHLVASSLEQG